MARNRIKRLKYPAVKLLKTFSPDTNDIDMAEMLGVSRSCVVRWRLRQSEINEFQADKFAIKLGMHPFEVWHNWLDDATSTQ